MTHPLQTYASALRTMGFSSYRSVHYKCLGPGEFRDVNALTIQIGPELILFMPGEESPYIEAAVRSFVLKIAPWSFAQPGNAKDEIVVFIRNAGREIFLAPTYADTYTEAWLNACVALVEAGMVSA